MATRSLPLTNKRQPKIPDTKAGLFLQILEFLLKVTGLSISLLGVLAWIAGACYRYGFWEAANNAGPLSAATLQETALHGFISPFATWMRAVGAILALSVITALSGLRVKFNFPKPIAARPPAWLSSRMGYDKSYAGLAVGFLVVACLLFSALLYPLAYWVVNSYQAGQAFFTKTTCSHRQQKSWPSSLVLDGGKLIHGWILDRTDKMLMLSDGYQIYTVSLGDKIRLMDTTVIAMDCKKASP
ncbi:hypothetical protein ACEU07_04305 [Chromobacterium violaceum]|uniref:hypothetical protein n=1 Tax=Chromobacterium violaceum TaxID=536 RepID=UPI0035A5C573